MPLTHRNLLTKIADIFEMGQLEERDMHRRPPAPVPFVRSHHDGLALLVPGAAHRVHPNPTESALLARVIDTYKATVLFGTPTFLGGIVRVASDRQLSTLRLAVIGAEKCPDRLFATLAERWPPLIVLEGYGITECSPSSRSTPWTNLSRAPSAR